jgi:predicted negative regulator of RcsB-dependent stress response
MAIDFDCPHCGTHYRLKDEVGGKTATCKNPNCRKVIAIPLPTSNGRPAPVAAPADLDSFAAAAFSDEPVQKIGPAVMIPVSCGKCDHQWQVEESKEGKNVLCPECRTPTRVPLRKKEEKADWRTGGGGPSLAKKETGLDRAGAFGTAHIGGISDQTARKIVKERDAEEEPEERRKKWLKRGAIAGAAVVVLGVVGFFLARERKQGQQEGRMDQAVAEVKETTKDPRYVALIQRASGEYRIRSSENEKDSKLALTDLQAARNAVRRPNAGIDASAILAQVALTMGDLVGTSEQAATGERLAKNDVVTEIRQAIKDNIDPELCADVLRALVRKGQAALAEDVARQLNPPAEMLAQVGLELMRINPQGNRPTAEAILAKTAGNDSGVQALRILLGKPPVPTPPATPTLAPAPKGLKSDAVSTIGAAEAAALMGDLGKARSAANTGRSEDKARGFAAAALAIIDSNPGEAGALAELAATHAKAATLSPWVQIRICRLLARAGKFEPAESLAATLADEQSRSWARLEILRGKLTQAGTNRAEDAWLQPVGDPAKLPAAAKAQEDLARHNAAIGAGDDHQKTVSELPGLARPFGTAGLILGRQDRDLK